MNILLFMENHICGGVDTFVVNLINNWPHREDRFTLLCNSGHPGLEGIRSRAPGCVVVTHTIPIYSTLARSTSGKAVTLLRRALSPVLRYLLLAYNVVAIGRLLRREQADAFMVVNGGYSGGDSCRAASIAWGRVRGSQSVHNYHNLATGVKWYFKPQEYLVDRLVARHTSAFVTVSGSAAASMSLRGVIQNSGKNGYIYNGLQLEARGEPLSVPELGSVAPGDKLCLVLASYEKRKGHAFLLDAFAQILEQAPQARLITCGFGSEEELAEVRELARLKGIGERVQVLGYQPDVSLLLERADVLLVPSQAYESFGLICVEAMAHRVPVVATDVGGLPEVVKDGEGGYCVGRQDLESFARRTVQLLTDEDLRRDQGEKGFQRYQRLFSAGRMAGEYAKLLRTPRPPGEGQGLGSRHR
jgi:L-malate glycosyltransferase